MSDRENRLKKIQNLLNLAEGSGFSEEAQAAREKAESLMVSWQIEQWEIDQRKKPEEREKPTSLSVSVCGENNPLKDQLVDLFGQVVSHCRCRAVYFGLRRRESGATATVIGYESDIKYAEMLYTSLRVQMEMRLQPEPDPTFSIGENVAMLKEAGMKWEDIYRVMGRHLYHPETNKKDMSLFNAYKKHCQDEGKKHIGTNPLTYQRNYIEGFVLEVARRLRQIKEHTKSETHTSDGSLVPALRDRDEDVKDLLMEMFPKLSYVDTRRSGKYDGAAQARGREAGANADLGQSKVNPRKAIG